MHRLSISLLLVVVVAIFGLGIALDLLFERYSAKSTDPLDQIQSVGQGLAAILNRAELPAEILSGWPDNQAYNATLESKKNLPLPSSMTQSFESGEAVVLESEQGVSFYYYLNRHDIVLALQGESLANDSEGGIAWIFTGAFYLGTLALVLLWLKPLLHRLHILKNTTKSFGAGQLESRVETGGVTYIRDIEQDFNRMADQIQTLIEDNKLLTSAVSHDLRTPLARLRFGIDTLSNTTSTDSRGEYLTRINSDLNEMEALVSSLLRFARLDNVMAGVQKQPVSVRDLVHECVSQYYESESTIHIDDSQLTGEDKIMVHGCIDHLATLLNNLIQNAVRYANHQLIIELGQTSDTVVINFCDDGPGIPAELRQQVMKPFERGQTSVEDGFGLGLAVAARIAKYHNGQIEIGTCERLGGALVSVTLDH